MCHGQRPSSRSRSIVSHMLEAARGMAQNVSFGSKTPGTWPGNACVPDDLFPRTLQCKGSRRSRASIRTMLQKRCGSPFLQGLDPLVQSTWSCIMACVDIVLRQVDVRTIDLFRSVTLQVLTPTCLIRQTLIQVADHFPRKACLAHATVSRHADGSTSVPCVVNDGPVGKAALCSRPGSQGRRSFRRAVSRFKAWPSSIVHHFSSRRPPTHGSPSNFRLTRAADLAPCSIHHRSHQADPVQRAPLDPTAVEVVQRIR